jgi:hypothetical protein
MANHEATTIDSSERSIPTQQRQSSSSDNSSPTTVTELLLLQAGPQLPLSPNSVVEKFQKETTTATTTTTTTKPKSAKTLQTVVGASIDSLPSSPVIDYEATSIDDDVEDEDFDDVWSVSCGSFRSDNNNKKTLSVRFSPLVRVKDTLSQHDMTLKEHFDYWLQDHDFLVIKQRNQEIIKAFEERIAKSGNSDSDNSSDDDVVVVAQKQQRPTRTPLCGPLVDTTMECSENDSDSENDNDVHCLRGLESCLQNENLRKRSFRFASLEEVFLEQEDQYYSGIYDDRAIATVYGEVTCECKFRAELRGRQDRRDIEEYLLLSSYLASERTR